MTTMNIGRAASASGVTPKMIRHYESVRLLERAPRSDAGYRHYGEREVHTLRFIRHARHLGFSIEQIRSLLDLWRDHERPSREVKAMAMSHIAALEAKETELRTMRIALDRLIHAAVREQHPRPRVTREEGQGDEPVLEPATDEDVVVARVVARGRARHAAPPDRSPFIQRSR